MNTHTLASRQHVGVQRKKRKCWNIVYSIEIHFRRINLISVKLGGIKKKAHIEMKFIHFFIGKYWKEFVENRSDFLLEIPRKTFSLGWLFCILLTFFWIFFCLISRAFVRTFYRAFIMHSSKCWHSMRDKLNQWKQWISYWI